MSSDIMLDFDSASLIVEILWEEGTILLPTHAFY